MHWKYANEYLTMGLFENLSTAVPYEFLLTEGGKAYHTMTTLLPSLTYDETKTNAMNLPAGVKGAAFQKSGEHVFILWAETTEDMSEVASATYSFPASFGLDDLEIYEYDYSVTGDFSMTSPSNIALTGTPIIISEEAMTGVAPTANFNTNVTEGCAPLTVQFSDNSAGSPTAWNWSFQGTNMSNSTAQNPSVTFMDAGVFGVTLTASNDFGMNTTSQNTAITVNDVPTVGFDINVTDLTVQFNNMSQNGSSYLWVFSDGQQSALENPAITFSESGNYSATLTVINACGNVSSTENFMIDVVATNEISGISNWSVFPNPNQGVFHVNMNGEGSKDLVISLTDVFGKEVLRKDFRKNSGNVSIEFKVKDLPSGLYLLTMQAGKEMIVEKVIVE